MSDTPSHHQIIAAFEEQNMELFEKMLSEAHAMVMWWTLELAIDKRLVAALPFIVKHCGDIAVEQAVTPLIRQGDMELVAGIVPAMNATFNRSVYFRTALEHRQADMLKLFTPLSNVAHQQGWPLTYAAEKQWAEGVTIILTNPQSHEYIPRAIEAAVYSDQSVGLEAILASGLLTDQDLREVRQIFFDAVRVGVVTENIDVLFPYVSETDVLYMIDKINVTADNQHSIQRLKFLQQAREDKRELEQEIDLPHRGRERKL